MRIDIPVHAKIVEKAGVEYSYLGGYDVSLALLSMPTSDSSPQRRGSHRAHRGADSRYSRHQLRRQRLRNNVIRAVEHLEAAGVACIHIEDQVR